MPAAAPRRAAGGAELDDPASYRGLDRKGMMSFAVHFPEQAEEAAAIGGRFRPPARLRNPANIVLAGMGGSAVAGDFLARLTEKAIRVPFVVCRDYHLPRFVGRDTLFIASSHSGDTEETLAATKLALDRKARVLCITTGGKLSNLARRNKLALITIPKGKPSMPPRAALGYSLVPLVQALGKLGLYPGAGQEIEETIGLLRSLRAKLGPGAGKRSNPAKKLAADLFGKIPWVQGTVGIMSAAAYRWRCQFNENSKVLAYSSEHPEMNHNEVVGWEMPAEMAHALEVIILTSPDDYYRVRERVRITRRMIARKARVRVIEAEGKSPLAQLMGTVYLGDFTSLYLAFLNGVDPASIRPIKILKRRLARLQPAADC